MNKKIEPDPDDEAPESGDSDGDNPAPLDGDDDDGADNVDPVTQMLLTWYSRKKL